MKHETFLSKNEKAQELVKLLASDCENLGDVLNLLKNLFAGSLEEMLESEMEEYLGYDKHNASGNNSRNGYNKKTLQSEFGETQINIPRDRNGDFEPKLIGKYQTKTDDLEKRIIAMYAKGMSNRDH